MSAALKLWMEKYASSTNNYSCTYIYFFLENVTEYFEYWYRFLILWKGSRHNYSAEREGDGDCFGSIKRGASWNCMMFRFLAVCCCVWSVSALWGQGNCVSVTDTPHPWIATYTCSLPGRAGWEDLEDWLSWSKLALYLLKVQCQIHNTVYILCMYMYM